MYSGEFIGCVLQIYSYEGLHSSFKITNTQKIGICCIPTVPRDATILVGLLCFNTFFDLL